MKTTNCKRCQVPVEYEPVIVLGKEMFTKRHCPACLEALAQEKEAEDREINRRVRESEWERICPPIYGATDCSHAGLNAVAVSACASWEPGPRGLGLLGSTGSGKTRSLFLALRRAFDAGKTCAYVTHNQFSRLAAEAFGGSDSAKDAARERLKRISGVFALLFDDLGKAPSTERADAELEELIEHRTSHNLPILWSANGSGAWLAKRFGEDRGEPLVRRLAEFCDVKTL